MNILCIRSLVIISVGRLPIRRQILLRRIILHPLVETLFLLFHFLLQIHMNFIKNRLSFVIKRFVLFILPIRRTVFLVRLRRIFYNIWPQLRWLILIIPLTKNKKYRKSFILPFNSFFRRRFIRSWRSKFHHTLLIPFTVGSHIFQVQIKLLIIH